MFGFIRLLLSQGYRCGSRAIITDTALRLATYFETSPDMWLSLQADYDLRVAQRDDDWKVAEKRIKAMKKVA